MVGDEWISRGFWIQNDRSGRTERTRANIIDGRNIQESSGQRSEGNELDDDNECEKKCFF